MWIQNFLTQALDIGLDVEFNKVVAQTIGEALFQNGCAIQCGLVGSDNVIINFNREGYTQSRQFFHCLFFVFSCFFSINTNRCFTIFFCKTQFFSYQFNIVSTIGGVAQTFHGIEVVLTNHWVNCVGTFKVIG